MTMDRLRRGTRLGATGGALTMLVAGFAAGPALAAGRSKAVSIAASTSVSASSSSATSSSSSSSSTSVSTGGGAAATVMSSSTMTSTGGGSPASAGSTASCTMPTLSQPFAAYGDSDSYAVVPGLSFDSVTGTGWTLSRGATLETATLADGATGSVLSLPSGAVAVSPPMCVQSDYPDARMLVRNASGVEGLTLGASYAGTNTVVSDSFSAPGPGAAWTASPVLQTHPGSQSGWQLVVFTLTGITVTPTQVYNFYVDPRMH